MYSLAFCLAAAPGCAVAPPAAPAQAARPPDAAAEPPADAAEPAASGGLDAESVAAQFARDWEDFRRLHAEQPTTQEDAAAVAPARPAASNLPPIQWNDSPGAPPPAPAIDAPATSATAAASGDDVLDDWRESPFRHAAASATHDGDNDAAEDEPVAPPLPAAAAAVSQDVRLRELMVALSTALYQDAAYRDTPLPQYLAIASMAIADPGRALNPEAIPDLTDRERELLAAFQTFFASIGAELAVDGDPESLVDLVESLRAAITTEPSLRIADAALCWRVRGFGRYDAFDRNAFLGGEAQEVIVYTELDDFACRQNDGGEWVTDLSQELIIYNQHDLLPVWRQPWMSAPDVSRNKRTDFFISHIITLPPALTVGSYTLKVRVKDEVSGAVAESAIDFAIVADRSLAAQIP
jgi:hypothetical protein